MSENVRSQIEELNRLYKQQDELYHNLAVRFGISDTSLWVLYAICSASDPCTQYDLSNAWCFPKQTVNSAIAGLEKAGYLTLKSIPGTRNRKEVVLTQFGTDFCARTVLPMLEAEKRAFCRLGEEERSLFLVLMGKQIACLREETEGITAK